MKKKIFLGIVLLLLIIQLKSVDKTNPPIIQGQDFFSNVMAPIEIKTTIKNACYDCHSHESKYPWYFNVAPISWWTKAHINGARENLNFSVWSTYNAKKRNHKLEEIADEIKDKKMPLKSYTWVHQEAKLNTKERETLIRFFTALSEKDYSNEEEYDNN